MILVDSNLLIYAINRSSPKHQAAQSYIQTYKDELCVAQQNILESLRVLSHPVFPHSLSISAAMDAITGIVDACTLLTPMRETYELTLHLLRRYSLRSDDVYDTYLVATALTYGVTKIATDNEKDFRVFTEITVINPFRINESTRQ